MPAIEKKNLHSKQEAVKLLAKEITAMQKRGYTLEQISEALKGQGLAVATPTLKSYLQRAKPEPARKTASASPTPAPAPAPASIPGKKGAKGTFTAKPDTRDI